MASKATRTRLNMRVPVELLDWTKSYVRKKNTSVTQLFIDHLTRLKEKHDGSNGKTAQHR